MRLPRAVIVSPRSPFFHASVSCVSVKSAFVTSERQAVDFHKKSPHWGCWDPGRGYVPSSEPMTWEA